MEKNERIVKEYVDGKTIFDLILEGTSVEQFLLQVRTMAKKAFDVGLNIDYFPTNSKQINYKDPKIGLKLPVPISEIADYDLNAPFVSECGE